MTDKLRAAAQQALLKLEKLRVTIDSEWGDCRDLDEIEIAGDQWEEVISLRAALAEQPAEPVAFVRRADLEDLKHANYMRIGAEGPGMYWPACDAKAPDEFVAVYAAPQPTPEGELDCQ
jgi:hypothetical protein